MLAILSSRDESSNVNAKDISFIHINSKKEDEIEIEAKPFALALARKLKIKKVFLFYDEKGKIIYDFKD